MTPNFVEEEYIPADIPATTKQAMNWLYVVEKARPTKEAT